MSVPSKIRVFSYNIHKGFSGGIPKFTLNQLRQKLHDLQPDILCLQEINGEQTGHRRRIKEYPKGSQFEFLAEGIWDHFSYGQNMTYSEGHHGNAILSRFPILFAENFDVSQNRIERRGIVHAMIQVPGVSSPIHVLSVHLGLLEWHRKRQLKMLADRLESSALMDPYMIIAGDFNDWRQRASFVLKERLQMSEAFQVLHRTYAKTFPSRWPIFCLDRLYHRGFQVNQARCLNDSGWRSISDHLALCVDLEISDFSI